MSEPEIDALTDEEARRLGKQRLRQIAANGGKQIKYFICDSCGQKNKTEIDIDDTDKLVRIVKYLDEDAKASNNDASVAAKVVLDDLREMPDEDLAELYVKLGGEA